MRGRFHPRDGQLYAAGLFGWAGNKIAPGGFYRIRRTQEPLHLPVAFQTASDGIAITFTNELDPASATDAGNFHVQQWNYQWRERYGSPDFKRNGQEGRDEVPVEWSALSPDRKTVFLKLQGLSPAMQMHTDFSLRAADGSPIRNFLHGSVFKLPGHSWDAIVDSGWSRGGTRDEPVAEQLAAGLLQEIRPFAVKHVEPDYRTSRLAALHVPEEAPPLPLFPPDSFPVAGEATFARS